MIKSIIIDNAGVLINTDCDSFYKKLAKHSPYSWPYINKSIEDYNFHIMEKGDVSVREWFRRVCKKFKIKNLNYEWLKREWPKIFFRNKPIEKFVRKNYKKHNIWMLTNTNSVHYSYLKKRFPIYNFIKNKVISYHIGMAKADKNIYEYTLRKIKIKPNECLFIDNKKENIITARRLGINTIWYKNYSQFSNELKKFKI